MKNKKLIKRSLATSLAVLTAVSAVFIFPHLRSSAAEIDINFEESYDDGYFTGASNLLTERRDSDGCVLMAVTGSDPHVTFNVENAATVFADQYKYVVITYNTPPTNSPSADTAELFLCAGGTTAPNEDCKVTFSPVNGYKFRSQIIDLSDAAYWTGQVHSIRFDAFTAGAAWDTFSLASVTFCTDLSSAEDAALAKAAAANGGLDEFTEAQLASRSYDLGMYTKRYWQGDVVINESYYPLCNQDGSISPAALMYDIKRIVSVRDGALGTEYKYGIDYTVTEDGKFQVIPTGSISKIAYNRFYSATKPNDGAPWQQRVSGGYIYCHEGSTFHCAQLAITYVHEEGWDKFVPESKIDMLPNTLSKLENKQHLSVVFYGDSITYGCNASGLSISYANPYMPLWADMTVAGLKAYYEYNDISYVNTAVGGKTSEWGAEEAQTRVAAYSPDLVFIAFGMNDGSLGISVQNFKGYIESIIATARAANPNCEFVIISSIVANPETLFVGLQEDYLPVLRQIEQNYSGVALADVMTSHKTLLTIKKYSDMTGNNVNHPNDFFIRYYAQTMLTTLCPPDDLDEFRAFAKNALSLSVDLSDYGEEEALQVVAYVSAAYDAIDLAGSQTEVRAALNNAYDAIASVKTLVQKEAEGLDYTCLVFNREAALTTVNQNNATRPTLAPDSASVEIASIGQDPHIRFGYDSADLSADEYKYVTLIYRIPSSVTNSSITQIFFTSGANTEDFEAGSIKFTAEKGGWVSYTANLSSASYWSGKIHNVRLDPFGSFTSGDRLYLHSIRLSKSASDAAEYSSRAITMLNQGGKTVYFDSALELARVASGSEERYVGDANFDGSVDSSDCAAVRRYVACDEIADFDCDLADADRDGDITIKDIFLIRSCVAGAGELPVIPSSSAYTEYDSAGACLSASPSDGTGEITIDVSDLSAVNTDQLTLYLKNPSGAVMNVTATAIGENGESCGESSFTLSSSSLFSLKCASFSGASLQPVTVSAIRIAFDATICVAGISFSGS
ncbi:MAG: hypothetical protein IJT70_01545 [Clostridia bacterium]|nr:hypothetical protein [Clostridia bacterium]